MKDLNSPWRKIASTIYKKPNDSKVFGSVDIDITDLEQYIGAKRKEGLKLTLTHFFLVAVARAIRTEVPELNTYIQRGKVKSFPQIDSTVSVLLADGDMSSVKVLRADELTLELSVKLLSDQIIVTRKGSENATMKMKNKLGIFPWPIRNLIYSLIKTITTDWGIALPFIGVDANSFGTFILSNVGTLGLDNGYPALLPTANISFVFILGGVNKRPWVVNDKVEVRKVMTLCAALDHRVVDASHAGKLFKCLKMYIRDPKMLEKPL